MKAKMRKINEVASWLLLMVAFAFMIYTAITAVNAARNDEASFLFGYRFVITKTGSMEPYMMTNSVALTKEVTNISELSEGDVITFHITNDLGKNVVITHRLINIEDGILYTQGDNNNSPDGIPLTMDQVESKVVKVFNQTAWIVAQWKTTAGKVMICCFVGSLLMAYFALKMYFKSKREEKEITMDLLDEYSVLAEKLGKTPRELFLEDLSRHKDDLSHQETDTDSPFFEEQNT